jgi:mannosyltransferase OCH1-like enzyme
VPTLRAFEFQMAIEELKRHKSPDIDQIPELITSSGSKIHSEILKIINSIWKKEEFPKEWKESIIVPTYK